MRICGYVDMWICRYVVMWICEYADMQICGHTDMLICGYANMQIYPDLWISGYASGATTFFQFWDLVITDRFHLIGMATVNGSFVDNFPHVEIL